MRVKLNSEKDIDAVVASMTTAEKLRLVGAQTTIYSGSVEELGIPAMCLADGATGINLGQVLIDGDVRLAPELRGTAIGGLFGRLDGAKRLLEQAEEGSGQHQLLSTVLSYYPQGEDPTSFPSGVNVGATWSPEEACRMGQALGNEMYACGVDVILGPNVEIQRDPLCGRAYECFGEDPYLVGKIAAAEVQGIQSQGVAACLKHFALNNQETDRNIIDTHVSQRAKREIYFKGFETAIKEGGALSVMSAYNKVDGKHCAENKELLTDILRDEWGFKGCVVSDWGAVHDEAAALTAGNDLVLPGPKPMKDAEKALQDGTLTEEALDNCVKNILYMLVHLNVFHGRKEQEFSIENSRKAAYDTVVAGSVLLRNEGVLPLKSGAPLSLWGKRSREPLAYGGGSTEVPSEYMTNLWDRAVSVNGADNCSFEEYTSNGTLIYVAGEKGQEGADIPSMDVETEDAQRLPVVLREAKARGLKTVVVLNVAGPVDMRAWLPHADAVLCIFLPGCEGGRAAADMIFGLEAPAGRLPMSFPVKYTDTPTWINFPGKYGHVTYGEGIYVGYRYYDRKEIKPQFPFGHGLTYTAFSVEMERQEFGFDLNEDKALRIPVTVTNTGDRQGAEVVQLYLSQNTPTLRKPVKELKAFQKVYLEPGETKIVELKLERDAFNSWDPGKNGWTAEPGEYKLLIGRSSEEIIFACPLRVTGTNPYAMGADTPLATVLTNPEAASPLFREVPVLGELIENDFTLRFRPLGPVLDAALIRQIPDAVAAKAAAKEIYEKLSRFSVG